MDLNQPELHQNQTNSENSLEEEDEPSIDFQSQTRMLHEKLLLRIGNCCLGLSIFLFLAQIINASVRWHLSGSSVITGFGFSILLFIFWACIDSVYGKGRFSENGKLEWCRQQISLRFKLHTIEEMKLKMPKRWLWFFTIIYFVVGFSIAICQAIILSKGNPSTRHWFTDQIIAARFAFAAVLILTGLFSIILMLLPSLRNHLS